MKLKESAKWKLSAILLVIFTGLALLTSCQKEQVEVVNVPYTKEEKIIGKWEESNVSLWDGGMETSAYPGNPERYHAFYSNGTYSGNQQIQWGTTEGLTWSIQGDKIQWVNQDSTLYKVHRLVKLTVDELVVETLSDVFVTYEKVQ